MVKTHNMVQWLECPQFEQDVRIALIDHCKMFAPSSEMTRFVFGGESQCERVQQLLVNVYCLHAYKNNYLSDPPDDCQDVQSWLAAWTRFHNRIMRKMVQTMQSTAIRQLDQEGYRVDGLDADMQA